jgi:ABC-2 type transport system permease protein
MGIWPITRKDLVLLSRDRRALTVLLVMPLIFIAILGFSTGQLLGWRSENELLKLAVVNRDHGPVAAQLVEALKRHAGIDVELVADRHVAEDLVHDGDRSAAVIIGPGFQRRVESLSLADVLDTNRGKLAYGLASLDIEVYTVGSLATTGAIVDVLVFGEAVRTIAPEVARRNPLARSFLQAQRSRGEQSGPERKPPTARPRYLAGYGSVVYQVLVPSYTVMFTFFIVTVMARSFLTEQELGTLRRLRTTPVNTSALLAGKTIPFFFVSLVQGILLFGCGKLLFGMSWGPRPLMLLPVIASTSLAATALGLLTATLVRTDAQVYAYANLVVITMAGISGCFMPRDWLPELMRQVSLATPHAWALIAYDQLLATTRPELARVWRCCAVLSAFAGGFFVFGMWRFRHVR